MKREQLILWLNKKIDRKSIIFDKVLEINSVLQNYILNNNLKLKISDDIFLIYLCRYLYENSVAY